MPENEDMNAGGEQDECMEKKKKKEACQIQAFSLTILKSFASGFKELEMRQSCEPMGTLSWCNSMHITAW